MKPKLYSHTVDIACTDPHVVTRITPLSTTNIPVHPPAAQARMHIQQSWRLYYMHACRDLIRCVVVCACACPACLYGHVPHPRANRPNRIDFGASETHRPAVRGHYRYKLYPSAWSFIDQQVACVHVPASSSRTCDPSSP